MLLILSSLFLISNTLRIRDSIFTIYVESLTMLCMLSYALAQIFIVIVFDGVQACKRPETK